MSRLYSQLLGRVLVTDPPSAYNFSPPAGFRWVIIDIVAHNIQTDVGGLNGFAVLDADLTPIWYPAPRSLYVGESFHWTGRQVVPEESYFTVATTDDEWGIRISGHELSLP